jgi:hypothetical protein
MQQRVGPGISIRPRISHLMHQWNRQSGTYRVMESLRVGFSRSVGTPKCHTARNLHASWEGRSDGRPLVRCARRSEASQGEAKRFGNDSVEVSTHIAGMYLSPWISLRYSPSTRSAGSSIGRYGFDQSCRSGGGLDQLGEGDREGGPAQVRRHLRRRDVTAPQCPRISCSPGVNETPFAAPASASIAWRSTSNPQ